MGSLLNDVNILITKRVGDLSRLEHIKETIENNKQLYDSDRKYIDDLTQKHLFSNETTNDIPKVEQTATIKEELPDETPKDSPTKTSTETTSQGSFCGICGNNMGSNNFCSKCGQSHTSSKLNSFCGNCGNVKNQNEQCQICNNKNNSKGKTSKKAGKIILYLLGLMVIIIGIIFFAFTMSLPMIFAGQYLILSLFILVIGGIIMYAGKRIKSN